MDKAAREEAQENPPLEKSAVLQECRAFNNADFVSKHPKRCCQLLTRLLQLLGAGERFEGQEASEVFFGVTKLFQSQDANLRRIVYLFIKEVAETTDDGEIIIVVQSLCKDMNQDMTLYKANAIRVLARIVDAGMLGQLERYMRQAIVDKDNYVAASALIAALHLLPGCSDIVRRWATEVQTAMSDFSSATGFLALTLLRCIKQADTLAVSKLLSDLFNRYASNPHMMLSLVRYAGSLVLASPDSHFAPAACDFIEGCVRGSDDMVELEAATALIRIRLNTPRRVNIVSAVNALTMFLVSRRPVLKLAALRLLNQLASRCPAEVEVCNGDIEELTRSRNRSIGTLAVTTLLKTGTEAFVEKLLGDLPGYMSDMSDDFKQVVVDAIHDCGLKYQKKAWRFVTFLSNCLREEGGSKYKEAIVNAMFDFYHQLADVRNEVLLQLCEFIEDCEYARLAIRVLHFIGDKGPQSPAPSPFVRYIYNRVILEAPAVRAAAVSALLKFGEVPSLRTSVLQLLQQCITDENDEVRDRAVAAIEVLGAASADTDADTDPSAEGSTPEGVRYKGPLVAANTLPYSVSALIKSLHMYQARPGKGAFDLSQLPYVADPVTEAAGGFSYEVYLKAAMAAVPSTGSVSAGGRTGATKGPTKAKGGAAQGGQGGGEEADASQKDEATETMLKALDGVGAASEAGSFFRSTEAVALTEQEVEYVVSLTKHVFESAVVLDYTITNTVDDVALLNVIPEVELSDGGAGAYAVTHTIPAVSVKQGAPGHAYVVLSCDTGAGFPTVSVGGMLRFHAADVDAETGEPLDEGFEDEYEVEAAELTAADFVRPTVVTDFRASWEEATAEGEVLASFNLPIPTVQKALTAVTKLLGVTATGGTGVVAADAERHNAYLVGQFMGGFAILARSQFVKQGSQTLLKIAIRSPDADLSQLLLDCIN